MRPLDQIDSVLRLLDREVWVVTAASGQRRGGLVAPWVAPASIDRERPVLLAAIAPNHFTAELILASRAFAAHLLRPDQAALAWNFADGSGRDRDKLASLTSRSTPAGAPLLDDCLAWCDCRVFARYDAGDRWFFWADVIAAEQHGTGPPLREQGLLSSLTDDERRRLIADRQADVAAGRALHDRWRSAQAGFAPIRAST
jgi:flavin reductase (DIM6/NTAB) family NADH-FMN oxidoreductase RutF